MGRPSWRAALALVAGFGVLTWVLAAGAFLDVDLAVRDWSDAHRPEPARLVAKTLYFLGSANLIAAILLVVALSLAARDRTARPVLLVMVTAAASYVAVVPLKLATDRSAPHAPWPDAVDLWLALRRLPLDGPRPDGRDEGHRLAGARRPVGR